MRDALGRDGSPMILYNLACYEALAGRRDDALGHLRSAIDADASFRDRAAGDPDFDAIRTDVSQL